MSPTTRVDPLRSGLLAQPGDHRLRVVDARHAHAARGQRQRDPARADRELERRAVAGQLGQQVDGGLDHRRVEHARRVRRRRRGDALAEEPFAAAGVVSHSPHFARQAVGVVARMTVIR